MKPSGNCRFCEIISGQYRYSGIDEPIASNDEFVAVASIGALVEGWTLIIPKTHQLSMIDVYRSTIFADFVEFVLSPLINQYGNLVAFEHGANKDGSMTGCGTDHAHLHLVPVVESLLPDLRKSELQWIQCPASEVASRSGKNEYLFYIELNNSGIWQDPVGYLHVLRNPSSQFFRRIIANRIGDVDAADYRRFPYFDTALQTRNVLAGSVA